MPPLGPLISNSKMCTKTSKTDQKESSEKIHNRSERKKRERRGTTVYILVMHMRLIFACQFSAFYNRWSASERLLNSFVSLNSGALVVCRRRS